MEAYLKDRDLSPAPVVLLSLVFWSSLSTPPEVDRHFSQNSSSDLILNLEFRMASQELLVIFLCLWKETVAWETVTA